MSIRLRGWQTQVGENQERFDSDVFSLNGPAFFQPARCILALQVLEPIGWEGDCYIVCLMRPQVGTQGEVELIAHEGHDGVRDVNLAI